MSIFPTARRRLVLAAVAGGVVLGGVTMAGSALAADTGTGDPVTAAGAATVAVDRLPHCDVVAVDRHDDHDNRLVWDVQMECPDDGTTQYVEIAADTGSVISINDDYTAGDLGDEGAVTSPGIAM